MEKRNLTTRVRNKVRYLSIKHLVYYKYVFHTLYGKIKNNYYEKKEVICSVTTVPERIENIHLSILSILKQSMRPHKVILYLGEELFETITLPEKLLKLQNFGLEIRFVKDVMVHTKYHYALQEFKDSIVITFDDDIMYNKNLVYELLLKHEEFDNAVICSRAHKMLFEGGNLLPYNNWKWDTTINKPTYFYLATGVGGVLYPPGCVDKRTFDIDTFFELSKNNDDIWLKCMQILNEYPVVTLSENVWFVETRNSQHVSLNSTNVHKNNNDLFLDNLFNKYKLSEEYLNNLEYKIINK